MSAKNLYMDIETTGLLHEDPSIWEIAIAEVIDYEIIQKFVMQFSPCRKFSEGAKSVSGIDPESLVGKTKISDYLSKIFSLLNGSTVYGWNVASFDNKVLELEFERNSFPFPKYQTVDLLEIARKHVDRQEVENATGSKRFDLQNVAKYFGVNQRYGNHRAYQDVETTVLVSKELSKYIDSANKEIATTPKNTDFVETIKSSLALLKSITEEAAPLIAEKFTTVSNDKDSGSAGRKIQIRRALIKKIGTQRTATLAPAKSIIRSVESMFADVIRDLTDNTSQIESERSRYLLDKSRRSSDIGNSVFESMRGSNTNLAIAAAENAAELAKVQKYEYTKDGVKIVNKPEFTIEIVNEDRIPIEFWSPDKKKMETHVKMLFDAFGIEPTIPGAIITCTVTAKKR